MSEKKVEFSETFDEKMYHTQEKWKERLTKPVKTTNSHAWLGIGYYFWENIEDAIEWGKNSKCRTGAFEVYNAHIVSDLILDTVFNRKHYKFWLEQVESTASRIIKKTGIKPTKKEINDYFIEKANWNVDGILFQEIPLNKSKSLVENFYYKKRIQLVVFNEKIIINFDFENDWRC